MPFISLMQEMLGSTAVLMPHVVLMAGVLLLLVAVPARFATLGALVTLALGAWASGVVDVYSEHSALLMLEVMPLSAAIAFFVYVTSVFLLWFGEDYCTRQGLQRTEFAVLILLAGEGVRLLAEAQHFIPFYIGIELMSLSFYVLTAFHPRQPHAAEAGVKYFTLGGLASCLILFGVSFIYAVAGGLGFETVTTALHGDVLANPAVLIGVVLVLSGVLFKLSIVPFHMWTADVYTGAPLPVMLALATLGKIGAVAVFASLFYGPFLALGFAIQPPLMVMVALSMLLGAVLALQQVHLQRILAYSSITHMGFAVMALLTFTGQGLLMALFFTGVYVLTTLATGAALLCLRRQQSIPQYIPELTGLVKTHPWLGGSLLVSLLSLAGLPPFVGFFAKVYVFQAVYEAGLGWLVVVGVVASAIAVAYSLMILKPIFFGDAEEDFGWEKHAPLLPFVSALGLSVALLVLFFWHLPFMGVLFEISTYVPYITY